MLQIYNIAQFVNYIFVVKVSFILLIVLNIGGVCLADNEEKISPYKILQKVASALSEAGSVEIVSEMWLQSSIVHIHVSTKNYFESSDDSKVEGRGSYSFLIPGAEYSTSEWVQSYTLRGIPFSWSSKDREWKKEILEIEEGETVEKIQYGLLSSLFYVNEEKIDPATVQFFGREEKDGVECFVVGYKFDKAMFEKQRTVGDVSCKMWVDVNSFRPVYSRIEGRYSIFSLVETAEYKNYDIKADFNVPLFISEEVKKEKDELEKKIKSLGSVVAQLRGWQQSEVYDIKVEFVKRNRMRDVILEEFDNFYSVGRIKQEEKIFQWLNLMSKEADYKESLVNLQVAVTVGLYVPQKKTIFLGDWLEPSIAEVVCVHEIVHAFQDKIIGLDKFLQPVKENYNYDLEFTLKSILEGDATAVSFEYLLNKTGESFKSWHDLSMIEDIMFKDSYLRNKVYYNIYGYGAQFIQACLDKYSWQSLDILYKEGPVSMKEIIHPQGYFFQKEFSGEVEKSADKNKLIKVSVPSNWTEHYSTILGEYLLFLSLSSVLDKDLAQEAAFGWASDKLVIYNNEKGEDVFFLLTKWDTDKDTEEFFRAYKQGLEAKGFKKMSEVEKEDNASISQQDTKEDTSLAEEKKFSEVSNTKQEFMLVDLPGDGEKDLSNQPAPEAGDVDLTLDEFIYAYDEENAAIKLIQNNVVILWTDAVSRSEFKEAAEKIFLEFGKE